MAPPDGVKVSPERLLEFSKQLDAAVGPHLDQAWSLLQGVRRLEHDLYTAVTYPLANAYVEGVEWVEEDLKSKRTSLSAIRDTLDATARSWAQTEQANTVRDH